MSADTLIAAYVIVLLGAVAALAFHSDQRRRRFRPTRGRDHIFHCEKCAFVYTDDDDVDRSRCPHCGAMNEEIKF